MADEPHTPTSAPSARAGGATLLAGLVVGVVALIALLLFLLPPAAGPIYTDLPPLEREDQGGVGALITLLPLSSIAITLVLLGTFVIPAIIRRRESATLGSARAIVIAGQLRGRFRLAPLLPVVRVVSFAIGALLTAISVVLTVPELLMLTNSAAVAPSPGTIDPTTTATRIDTASLIAMVAGVAIFGGLLLFILPSLNLRLPKRTPRPAASAVSDHAPSVFVARTELPPEIAALFPAPPRRPTRMDRFAEIVMTTLKRMARGGIAMLRLVGRAARAIGRMSLRTIVATGQLLWRFGFALLTFARRSLHAVRVGLMISGRATVTLLRFAASLLMRAGAQSRSIAYRLGVALLQLLSILRRTTAVALRTIGHGIGVVSTLAATFFVATLRALFTLLVLFGHAIILATVALFLIGLALLDLLARTLVAALHLLTFLLRTTLRYGYRLLDRSVRAIVGLPTIVVRRSGRIAAAITRRLRALRVQRQIDEPRRPAEGGPMTAPATILVVALAPQSGKSTVAAEASRLLGSPWINSSAVIAERLEQRLGLAKGQIAAARVIDHDAYRPALIEEGDRMAAEGTSPGVECVRRGYRVIDGIRRRTELEAAVAEIRRTQGHPIVICVRRPNAPALADNTEAVALAALADVIIDNDGPLSRLRRQTASVLRRYRAL
jgi:hypothetical protein